MRFQEERWRDRDFEFGYMTADDIPMSERGKKDAADIFRGVEW
jgi:hypothetical protein